MNSTIVRSQYTSYPGYCEGHFVPAGLEEKRVDLRGETVVSEGAAIVDFDEQGLAVQSEAEIDSEGGGGGGPEINASLKDGGIGKEQWCAIVVSDANDAAIFYVDAPLGDKSVVSA